MKRNAVLILVLIITYFFGAQNLNISKAGSQEKAAPDSSSTKKDNSLVWYKYDEGLAKAKKENKHAMVHFYTTWCGWCKRMDRNTFGNEDVKEILSESYVSIRVNGQSGSKVKVDGKEMSESQVTRGYKVSAYPVTWFLKPSGDPIAPRKGYVDPNEFSYILNWVKADLYDSLTFGEFVEQEQKKKKSEKE
jgi:thioredoxin-related protein